MAINNPLVPGDPYSYDLKWLVEGINKVKNDIENFVAINAIKYADPIEWDITSQYGANTVVVDAQTGNAYISVKPVPAGVSIENTDFWAVVFNYQESLTELQKQIAVVDEGSSETATETREPGQLLWLNGVLHKVIREILPGERYVEDSNVVKETVEKFINNLHVNIIVDSVEELKRSSARSGEYVITSGHRTPGDFGGATYRITDTLPLEYYEELESGLYAVIVNEEVTPEMFGAYGDGIHDDTTAINTALLNRKNVVFNRIYGVLPYTRSIGTYTVRAIDLNDDNNLMFNNGAEIRLLDNNLPSYAIIVSTAKRNIKINGGRIVGDKDRFSGSSTEFCHGVVFDGGENIKIKGLEATKLRGDGLTFANNLITKSVVDSCILDDNGRNAMSVVNVDDLKIIGCTFSNTNRTAPMYGIDLEPNNSGQTLKNVEISDCTFYGNSYGAVRVISRADGDNVAISNCVCDGCAQLTASGSGSHIVMNNSIIIGGEAATAGTSPFHYARGTCLGVMCFPNSSIDVSNVVLDCSNSPNCPIFWAEDSGAQAENITIDVRICNGTASHIALNRGSAIPKNCDFTIKLDPNFLPEYATQPPMKAMTDSTNKLRFTNKSPFVGNSVVAWFGDSAEIIAGQSTNVTIVQLATSPIEIKNGDSVVHGIVGATFVDTEGVETNRVTIDPGKFVVLTYSQSENKIYYRRFL